MEYRIALLKTNGKKIYVDPGEKEGFYLYPGEIRKLRLEEGQKILEEDFEKIRLEYAVPRAKKRALGILAKRDKTEKELRDKLEESYTDSLSLEMAMDFVKSFGYVDDYQFAKDYLYFKKGKKSHRVIRLDLQKKGISSELLDRLFEEEGKQKAEDVRELVEKYARKFPELDRTAQQKVYAHFYRKGYSNDVIREVLDDIRENM